ncbi:zinc finger MYM-type protein 2 isoform X4 [Latimeria chalumnae]|uniref:zinc finger MYM-type protein 2 isoform X4 n=1 Tax=Latimeria chalumnae TaxID=7897 RepID=UPI00313E5F4D
MATSLSNLGTTFDSQSNNLISNSSKLQPSTMEEDDDDVVFIEPSPLPISAPTQLDQTKVPFTTTKPEAFQKGEPKTLSSKDSGTQLEKVSEPIVIDDEEDIETNLGQEKIVSSVSEGRFVEPNRTSELELTTSKFPRSLVNAGLASSGITTEPDSEIQIANVTTLDGDLNSVSNVQLEPPEGGDMNLMITNVTSLQNSGIGNVGNGHQSNNFGINMQMYTPPLTSQTKAGIGSFNPGRVNTSGEVFQNGESLVHHIPDSWISQSASFPRNQKQPGADSMSPVGSLPKPVFQPPAPQQSSKPVKVTCANCKKPLQKGQTAYQRKGSAHLFCSTTCLSAFSHKPAPKKLCTMCKKDITTMKGTIVAQVESSESFQEFCSTSCLSMYEDKQNASKGNSNKSRCTVCGKLTEIRHEVSFKNMTHKLCSDHCFNRYRMANGLVMNCCEQCGEYLPSKGAANNFLLIDGQQKRFCCQNCLNEYKQATRCDCCKTQGTLRETVQWRGEMKHFCDQHCLLRFYCQQNEPNMSTQKGPENMQFDQGSQVSRSKMVGPNISSSAPPPSPTSQKEMKNKAVLCKPLTMTKATYCKPHMQTKSCQTEEDVKTQYVPVPIPVPVYIPIPMHMYSQNTPIPVSVPVPVPVPVFLPTTLDSAERIVETIEELKAKVPSDPVEADILAMAEMIAEAEEKTEEKQSFNGLNFLSAEEGESEITQLSKCASEEQASIPDVMYEKELDLEIDFPRATEELDTENEFLLPLVFGEEYEEQPKPQVKKKGAKRKAVFGHHSQDGSPEYRFPFNYAYGVNAWKHWVLTKNSDEHGLEIDDLKSAKAVRLKEDLQSHTADELSCGLARFVHEIRRPNGESYAPDSIYYLCLGIQKYLYENSRTDNIFSDPGYQMFDQELTKILRSWQPSILPDGSIFSRVEEDYLWSAKQLGSHSPVVLLNTLLYFNTKYFGLKTVEQHLRLSFGNIVRQWKKNPLTKENTVCLQYQVPSLCGDDTEVAHGKRKHEDDDDLIFEQRENTVNPSQCPVKMFECYLSKSPQSLTQRMDVFYLQPDFSSFQKDGAMWYTTTPLDRSTLENMLARVLLIKDIYDEKDSYELDDDNE